MAITLSTARTSRQVNSKCYCLDCGSGALSLFDKHGENMAKIDMVEINRTSDLPLDPLFCA